MIHNYVYSNRLSLSCGDTKLQENYCTNALLLYFIFLLVPSYLPREVKFKNIIYEILRLILKILFSITTIFTHLHIHLFILWFSVPNKYCYLFQLYSPSSSCFFFPVTFYLLNVFSSFL